MFQYTTRLSCGCSAQAKLFKTFRGLQESVSTIKDRHSIFGLCWATRTWRKMATLKTIRFARVPNSKACNCFKEDIQAVLRSRQLFAPSCQLDFNDLTLLVSTVHTNAYIYKCRSTRRLPVQLPSPIEFLFHLVCHILFQTLRRNRLRSALGVQQLQLRLPTTGNAVLKQPQLPVELLVLRTLC